MKPQAMPSEIEKVSGITSAHRKAGTPWCSCFQSTSAKADAIRQPIRIRTGAITG